MQAAQPPTQRSSSSSGRRLTPLVLPPWRHCERTLASRAVQRGLQVGQQRRQQQEPAGSRSRQQQQQQRRRDNLALNAQAHGRALCRSSSCRRQRAARGLQQLLPWMVHLAQRPRNFSSSIWSSMKAAMAAMTRDRTAGRQSGSGRSASECCACVRVCHPHIVFPVCLHPTSALKGGVARGQRAHCFWPLKITAAHVC